MIASNPNQRNAVASTASTEQTVFVRFNPPSANIRRHHLENLFSDIGPIRKSSVIVPRRKSSGDHLHPEDATEEERPAASYGFIKYTSASDAAAAAAKLDHTTLRLSPTEVLKLRVERASDAATRSNKDDKKSKKAQKHATSKEDTMETENTTTPPPSSPSSNKAHRLIVRNLSFYAKENHIRSALESKFGKVVEVHIPQVPGGTHRGFCFVTFEKPQSAQACLQYQQNPQNAKDPIVIHKRAVSVAAALNKTMYETNKKKKTDLERKHQKNHRQQQEEDEEDAEAMDEENQEDDSDSDDSDDSKSGEEKDNSDSDNGDSNSEPEESTALDGDHADDDSDSDEDEDDNGRGNQRDESAVSEKRALFVRNLPFDATRHDLFEVFRKFGHITGIFLVKDRETGIPKGTAFVSFRNQDAVTKALELARADKFVSQRDATEGQNSTEASTSSGEFSVKGRHIFVSLALDKDTAATLVMEKSSDRHTAGKDRRNLYLKGEGRVDNESETDTAWDNLPEQDKTKRQRAWSEKNSKLRSPIFFINPNRLSIRNLYKQVDEQEFKRLCVIATKRGLEKGLVTAEDVIAHWRASGDMSTREIMDRVEAEGDSIIAPFDEKNVRKHIPSVFIDRDFTGNKKSSGLSRGFGFVEFAHHSHALACLRELNNNLQYSEEFVAGGKHALDLRKKARKPKKTKEVTENEFVGADGLVKVPRLIVEFTAENKAKARQQSEHRAQQQANKIKQLMENKEKSQKEKKKEKKISRGAKQRERKRKGPEEQVIQKEEPRSAKKSKTDEDKKKEPSTREPLAPKPKAKKPRKKQPKLDAEDSNFEHLVRSYEKSIDGKSVEKSEQVAESPKKNKKRWFE